MRQERLILALIVFGLLATIGWSVARPWIPVWSMGKAPARVSQVLGPADIVRHFYADISGKRYEAAYALLTSHYRAGTSLAAFREGYKTTVSVSADATGDRGGHVKTTLNSVDVAEGGAERHRTFAGAWNLIRESNRWHLNDGNFHVVAEHVKVADQTQPQADDGSESSSDQEASSNLSVEDQAGAIAARRNSVSSCVQSVDEWKRSRFDQTMASSKAWRPISLEAANRYMKCVASGSDDRSYFEAANSAVMELESAEKIDGVSETACDPDRREIALLENLRARTVPVIYASTLELQYEVAKSSLDSCIEGT